MKTQTVKLGDYNISPLMDLQKLIYSRLLVQANSGGGKSWAIRRIVEQSHGMVQQIILDSEGEFGTLREKYDFILVGKDGDTPADPRSAGILARKLLEIGVSAIVDLYELHPQERKRFVKDFLNGMINAPKELWHECIVVLDEAHIYAPEKGQSEALDAVIGMASLGRKRGFCLIPATQRISKLHKDVAAECNNKLIGRTGLDIDMKRAGEELGFTSKEQMQSLRRLKPGEFYMFGPALSDEVISVTIGSVNTSHARTGVVTKITPPTEAIKKIIGQLGDLPEEAKKEAQTMQELRDQVRSLTEKLRQVPQKNVEIDLEKVLEPHLIAFGSMEIAYKNKMRQFEDYLDNIVNVVNNFTINMRELSKQQPDSNVGASYVPLKKPTVKKSGNNFSVAIDKAEPGGDRSATVVIDRQKNEVVSSFTGELGKGEVAALKAIAQFTDGVTREHITILTGYKRSSRDAYIQRLRQKGLVEISGDKLTVTDAGMAVLGDDFAPLPTGEALRNHLMQTLPLGEKTILELLIANYPDAIDRERLSEQSGYQRSSRDAYLQRLNVRQLVTIEGRGMVKANAKLF